MANKVQKKPKRSRVQINFVLTDEQRQQIRELSKTTRIPQATHLREAIADLLDKYGQDATNTQPPVH
ncbi:MAG: ribbon-helix-helix domain-containing protein [Dehalococcoidia bacterium]|jgi:predicted DNA-binding protein